MPRGNVGHSGPSGTGVGRDLEAGPRSVNPRGIVSSPGCIRRRPDLAPNVTLDDESARWLASLVEEGAPRERALGQLHAMLLGVARAEAFRRRGSLPSDIAADLDDLCMQAANDAMAAILRKLETFRGASRFTTWAYKFAVLEVSVRLRRRAWSTRRVAFDELAWDRVADSGAGVEQRHRQRELLAAVRHLVETSLTDRQRSVFLAAVAEDVPIDVIAERAGTSRGAVYKTLHDARRKLRDSLIAAGHMEAK